MRSSRPRISSLPGGGQTLTREALERTTRLATTTHQAAAMLGVRGPSYLRACKREGIAVPFLDTVDPGAAKIP